MIIFLRSIAHRLSRYPALKRLLKYIYQLLMFVLHYHRNRYLGKFPVEKISRDHGGFFGYYDKSPESPDRRYIIYHEFTGGKIEPGLSNVAIILYEISSAEYTEVHKTIAFNLQIGSRLQWISNDSFIFNAFDKSRESYISYKYIIAEKRLIEFPQPVFDICNGKYLSLNFSNLSDVGSEYGYRCTELNNPPSPPYIIYGRLEEASGELIVSLDDIDSRVAVPPGEITNRHFNHITFSPMGTKFIFIYRWTSSSGRQESLLMYDFSTTIISVLNNEMTSHCCWVNDDVILGYMAHNGTPGYYYLDTTDFSFKPLGADVKLTDGHPSFKNELILTDTYPGHSRMQDLMIISKGKVLLVGSFYAPLTYHEQNRCDLHPRFNQKGDTIYIDSKHNGQRNLYRVKMRGNE